MKTTNKINVTKIIAVLVLSAFIATLNETILNVALSGIMKEMSVTAATVQWLITAYMIVTSVMVPVTAFLIQTFKTRNLFFSALGLLLIGTVCAACSGSFAVLLISRMIQASGTGMMIPIMMNTVFKWLKFFFYIFNINIKTKYINFKYHLLNNQINHLSLQPQDKEQNK